MLAYLSWHRPAAHVEPQSYEHALSAFHASLARRPPSGFRGSAVFRLSAIDWLAPGATAHAEVAYEDWYLLDGWSALGVLEQDAVAHGHVSRHDTIAAMSATAAGGVYRLSEGHARLAQAGVGVWVARAPGYTPPTLADLLGDGMDPQTAGLWRRSLGLGPAPEYCLLAAEAPPGVAPGRLPDGWRASVRAQEVIWSE